MTKFKVEFNDKNGVVVSFNVDTQDEPTAYTWAEKQREAMKSNPKISDPKKLKVKVTEIKAPAPTTENTEKPTKPVKPTKADKKSKKPKKDVKESTGQRIKLPPITI